MERNDDLNDDMHEYDVIKGYYLESDEIEIKRYLRVWLNKRQRYERWIECGLG